MTNTEMQTRSGSANLHACRTTLCTTMRNYAHNWSKYRMVLHTIAPTAPYCLTFSVSLVSDFVGKQQSASCMIIYIYMWMFCFRNNS